jgi:hypothetical protein
VASSCWFVSLHVVSRILLIHWNEAEAEDRVQRLRNASFSPVILTSVPNGPADLKRVLENPIAAIVIDLSRRPSLGRDVALGLRSRKTTRHIPIVFVDGEPDKVSRVKSVLPDAVFAEWPNIGTAVKTAIKNRPADPVVQNVMAGYSGTPLPKKLGIKPGLVVALVNAPNAFERTLDPLPDGVLIKEDLRGKADIVVVFASRIADIYEQFPSVERSLNASGRLWIAWPKQASGVKTDITHPAVHAFGLAAGWVDFKICAIDETWSGLAFARRKAQASRVVH